MRSEYRRLLVLVAFTLATLHCLKMATAEEVYRDPTRSVDERVHDLLGRMTLQEKIDQLS